MNKSGACRSAALAAGIRFDCEVDLRSEAGSDSISCDAAALDAVDRAARKIADRLPVMPAMPCINRRLSRSVLSAERKWRLARDRPRCG